jgi:hypothetical protein
MPDTGVTSIHAWLRLTLRKHLARSILRQSRFLLSASPITETDSRNCATLVEQTVQVT